MFKYFFLNSLELTEAKYESEGSPYTGRLNELHTSSRHQAASAKEQYERLNLKESLFLHD